MKCDCEVRLCEVRRSGYSFLEALGLLIDESGHVECRSVAWLDLQHCLEAGKGLCGDTCVCVGAVEFRGTYVHKNNISTYMCTYLFSSQESASSCLFHIGQTCSEGLWRMRGKVRGGKSGDRGEKSEKSERSERSKRASCERSEV